MIDYLRVKESGSRWHAVYITLPNAPGAVHVTWCGRSFPDRRVTSHSFAPPARCHACLTRIRLPYLVPQRLRELRRAAVPGLPPAA